MLKKLLFYTKGYRKWIALGVLCSIGESVAELFLPLLMADIVDIGIQGGDQAFILQTGIKMILLALFALLMGVGAAVLGSAASQGFGANLRAAQYEKVQGYAFSNLERFSTASLITRLTTDVNTVQMTLMMGIRMMVRAPVMMITALIFAITISRELSEVFWVAIPLLVLLVGGIIAVVGPLFTKLQQRTDDLNLVVQENLRGIRVVKSFVRETFEESKFAQRNTALRSASEKAFGLVVLNMPLMMLVIYGTMIAVLWLGGHMVALGTLEVGLLSSFFTYITEILVSLMMLSVVMMMLTRAVACGRRIVEVLEETPELTDAEADSACTVQDGSVRFEHVFFRYHPDGAWNLEDISLDIRSGMTVGILGGTGSAKTTLVSLIPRLYEVTEGRVLVGGRDVRRYSMEHLRDACAMVLQKNTLFTGTVAENLRWGNPNATEEQLREACRAACAEEFLEKMPDGYRSHVEQGGANFSGGQRQRLCIARALLKEPKILILDDSTSAVDMATDAKIRESLRTQLPQTTKIIIAQRIASVQDADCIVVMDDGHIDQIGTHEQLLQSCAIYQEVYQSQQQGGAMHE